MTSYSEAGRDTASSTTTHTITGLTSGQKYIVLVFQYSSQGTSMNYDRFDTATVSGGSMTKISNLLTVNAAVAGTFFTLSASAPSVTISTAAGSKNSRVILFQGEYMRYRNGTSNHAMHCRNDIRHMDMDRHK